MTVETSRPALSPPDAMDSAYTGQRCLIVAESGDVRTLPVSRWLGDPDAADHELFVDPSVGPTLDIGCGPGRLTAALAARQVPAMGIDASAQAVRLTRARGAQATLGDIYGPVPHEGRWATALLADGNIGIGGDPARLLRRVRRLLAPGGVVLVELDAAGTGLVRQRLRLRFRNRDSAAFDWALVGVDAIDALTAGAGLSLAAVRESGGRIVGLLTRAQDT